MTLDPTDDAADGALFRFWCAAASYPGGSPSALMLALAEAMTIPQYREALARHADECEIFLIANPKRDLLDGVLFRFWVNAIVAWPMETAKAISPCNRRDQYRRALVRLAESKRINLPGADDL